MATNVPPSTTSAPTGSTRARSGIRFEARRTPGGLTAARLTLMASWRDNVDGGQQIDWGRSAADYGEFRPGPPASFYRRLRAFDIGCRGQRILDLGTGTGVLAREFARAGSLCAGVDISAGQIAEAKRLAHAEAL